MVRLSLHLGELARRVRKVSVEFQSHALWYKRHTMHNTWDAYVQYVLVFECDSVLRNASVA